MEDMTGMPAIRRALDIGFSYDLAPFERHQLQVGVDELEKVERAMIRLSGPTIPPGMVGIYDHNGKYLGCMGIHAWTKSVEVGHDWKKIIEARDELGEIAERLFQMIDRQTWIDAGGDDGQGHYEGDYYADRTRERIRVLRMDRQ